MSNIAVSLEKILWLSINLRKCVTFPSRTICIICMVAMDTNLKHCILWRDGAIVAHILSQYVVIQNPSMGKLLPLNEQIVNHFR